MTRIGFLALASFAIAGAASAQATLSIPLRSGATDSVQSQTYTCGGGEVLSVQYVNAGPNSLALLSIEGEERIFVNVVAASGARYVSGAHVWWTKGETATLENRMEEGSIVECAAE